MTDAPFSLDRLSDGELVTTQRPWSILLENRGQEYRFSAATTTAAIYSVLSLLVDLGYTIGITKSVLYPTTSVEYLGLTVDSVKQAFIVPGWKIEASAVVRKNILGCKKYTNIKTLQRFQEKFISFSLAVSAAKLFIREINHAIASANDNGRVSPTPCSIKGRTVLLVVLRLLARLFTMEGRKTCSSLFFH